MDSLLPISGIILHPSPSVRLLSHGDFFSRYPFIFDEGGSTLLLFFFPVIFPEALFICLASQLRALLLPLCCLKKKNVCRHPDGLHRQRPQLSLRTLPFFPPQLCLLDIRTLTWWLDNVGAESETPAASGKHDAAAAAATAPGGLRSLLKR